MTHEQEVHRIQEEYERETRRINRDYWRGIFGLVMAWQSGFVAGILVVWYFTQG